MKNSMIIRGIQPIDLSGITAVFLLVICLSSCHSSKGGEYSVLKGHFIQSVKETGELAAVNASYLSIPRISFEYGYSFKIIGLAEHGSTVHKGDTVFTVDPSVVQRDIIQKSELLETETASTNKLKAQITNNLQDLRSQIRNEEASYEIKKLAYEKSGFESAGIRKVAELEFRLEEIKLNKIRRNLQIRPRLDSLDLHIQEIKVKQKEAELIAAQAALARMKVISPLDGIFVVSDNWRNGQTIRVGDEIYVGNPVAQIPDIRTMKVKGFIPENDIGKIKADMEVIIRLDALPSVPFQGTLKHIGKICIEQDNKKIFPTEVFISGSDPRLKPGMTVSCEYISFESSASIYVPNSCLLEENKHYYLFPVRWGKPRKTEVKTGPSNNTYTIVTGDIREGQSLELPANINKKN